MSALDEAEPVPVRRTPEHWVVLLGALAGLVVMVLLGLFVEPDPRGHGTHETLGLAPCLFVELWGIPCPGCGVTTAVTLAARGELLASLVTQPFGFALALGTVIAAVWAPWVHLRGGDLGLELRRFLFGKWLWWSGVFVVASWAYKAWEMRD